MSPIVSKEDVQSSVEQETIWWVKQRMDKLQEGVHDTMSVNPFLIPILFDLHSAANFSDLAELLLAGHLMTGHNTGFGKLVDERILPATFHTSKLTSKYRGEHPPLNESCFDDIDHVVPRPGDKPALLSLKSGRWTIQLSGAVNLNRSFAEIISRHSEQFAEITVGVVYGRQAALTDKYDILRGINRGKEHNVIDLQNYVRVYAGREFWAWMNGGELETQNWVLDGILQGLHSAESIRDAKALLDSYKSAFNAKYAQYIKQDGSVDWHAMLTEING